MYKIPALDTVAGVAYTKSLISNSIFICYFNGILSLLARVKILLSSMTEFILSIQFASKSPSNTIHLGKMSVIYPRYLKVLLSRPSFHSRVAKLFAPYNSSGVIDLGLISTIVVFLPTRSFALAKIFQVQLFPAPGGPITNTQCRISNNSHSYTTFRMNSA